MERAEAYQDKVYTIDEVAAIFQAPSDTVRRLIRRGDLPAIRLGRVYRVPKSVDVLLTGIVRKKQPDERSRGRFTMYYNGAINEQGVGVRACCEKSRSEPASRTIAVGGIL